LSGFCHSCLVNAKNSNFANKLTTWGQFFDVVLFTMLKYFGTCFKNTAQTLYEIEKNIKKY